MKICPVGAEFFNADKQTNRQTNRRPNMMVLMVAVSKFANVPKYKFLPYCSNIRKQEVFKQRIISYLRRQPEELLYRICRRVHFHKSTYALPSFPQLTKSLHHSYIVDK